jgi:O-antigen/teichoic acid export membrane protein
VADLDRRHPGSRLPSLSVSRQDSGDPWGGWRRRVGLNSFWLLAARLGPQALGLLFTAALARALGEAGLGQFAFISAVLFIGNAVTTFGLDTLLIREVAGARATMAGTEERGYATRATMGTAVAQTISAALLIQLALSAVFIAGLWLLAPRLPNQTAATLPALRVAALALFPLALATVDSALLRAHERMAHFLAFSLATAAALALGGLALLAGGGGLPTAAVVFLVAQVVGAAVAAGLARRALPGVRRWAWPAALVVGQALRLGAGLALLMALSLLYQRSGVLLLSLLDGDAAAGAYSAAARVIEALKALPAAFFGAMFPILAAGRHQPAAGRAYRRAFAALLVVSGLLAATAGLLARPILGLLFGPGFEAAVPALRIMVWSLPPTIVAFKLSLDLVVAGRERAAAAAVALTLLIGGGLTAWLIGRWSLSGAAVGLVVGEVVQVIVLKTSGVCGKPLRSGAGQ